MKKYDPFQSFGVKALYHFTDRRNIPSIRKHGGLFSLVELHKRGIKVPNPGGNDWSHKADAMKGVDHYVHLCLRKNHPMEYQARQQGHIEQTIFLEIELNVLNIDGVKYSPGVSNKSDVEICPINDATDLIDFEVLYTRQDWTNAEIKDRLQKAGKCEVLVPDHVPIEYIRNLPNG